MATVTFDSFDPGRYQKVPPVNILGLSVLTKALLEAKPVAATESVQKRAGRLQKAILEIEDELTNRRRAKAPSEYGVPVELDGATDGLWTLCFRKLELLAVYLHSGFDPFIAKPETPLGASLGEGRKLAERAAVLLDRLFGTDGLSFTRGGFREQSETAGSILRLIQEDNLTDELAKLVGAALVEQLTLLHEHYETMVVHQLTAGPSSGLDLRAQRWRLQKLIERYNNAVLDMLDEDEPESLDVVVAALRPMVTLRELLARGKSPGQAAAPDEPVSEAEAELEAALEQAIEAEVDEADEQD